MRIATGWRAAGKSNSLAVQDDLPLSGDTEDVDGHRTTRYPLETSSTVEKVLVHVDATRHTRCPQWRLQISAPSDRGNYERVISRIDIATPSTQVDCNSLSTFLSSTLTNGCRTDGKTLQ
jgi:hypothetical protein